ncbi:MAG TPA: sulfite oxidase-like oxidoreductase [Candidatus Limnocylindria bacterium]|nr:sulfite oxidase-like oxidoreductase [Candidatus Limnocylindria bacterium]
MQASRMVFAWQRVSDDPAIVARTPPGQVLTHKFPVLHFGQVPAYPDLSRWDFRVFGDVETPFSLSWTEFRNLPVAEVTLDIHCVTRWSKLDTTWEGVPFAHIAEVAQPRGARHVTLHSEHGYTTNIPLEVALDTQSILAWHYDRKPLEPDHGYPLRAIVPGRYFWKSAKWLRAIEFTVDDRLGFWERNGYSNSADPWREERYSDP